MYVGHLCGPSEVCGVHLRGGERLLVGLMAMTTIIRAIHGFLGVPFPG